MSETTIGGALPSTGIVPLLQEQAAIAEQLGTLVSRQSALIESRRTDALLALLSARQRLVKRFDELQSRLTASVASSATDLTDAARAQADELIASITQRVEAILAGDERDRAALTASRDDLSAELRRVDSTSRARRAYTHGLRVDNRFADRKG